MRSATLIAVALAAAALAGCAGGPRPPIEGERETTAAPDTTGAAVYDEFYVELAGGILSRLARLEARLPGDVRLVEARTMLRVAEELYLGGDALSAVEYLQRIEELLRDVP
ncbi:MAG: hypothetical protein JW876_11205 [Candidatus Krumholzibacteriota bacterium]|nr:hypothetical protein [Candidatus Krumholzibacteriota bacterium]